MLREELRDGDIPHRTHIRQRIGEIWEDHISDLEDEMKVHLSLCFTRNLANSTRPQKSLGMISLTSDLWSDSNLTPFMAVTAHWIQGEIITTPQGPQYKLNLRADLIGFHRVPGRHSGDRLACAFMYILDRVDIAKKV